MMGKIIFTLYRIYQRTLSSRKIFYKKLVARTCATYEEPLKVNFFSTVSNTTFLGANVNFNGINIEGKGRVTIGNNFHSGKDCKIISQTHNYEGKSIPYDSTYIVKDVWIGDNVWIGDRVIILGGVKIEEGAIIQAGSTVVSDIPACAIAGGHPAKVFKYRNEEHYFDLKQKNQFH